MTNLETDNYILQEYFFKNFKHVTSLHNVNLEKVYLDLKDIFSLTEVKHVEVDKQKIALNGHNYLILSLQDIQSMINIYEKSYELTIKYNLPTICNNPEGKKLKNIVKYCHSNVITELLVFEDNTFYFLGTIKPYIDYEHQPSLHLSYFSYNYYFFKYIGNEEIAKEFEDYRSDIKYFNRN